MRRAHACKVCNVCTRVLNTEYAASWLKYAIPLTPLIPIFITDFSCHCIVLCNADSRPQCNISFPNSNRITWWSGDTARIHEITRFVNRSVISSHRRACMDQIVSCCKLPLGISLRVAFDWDQSYWSRVFNTPNPATAIAWSGPLAAIWQPGRPTWRPHEGTPAAGEAANVPWQSRQRCSAKSLSLACRLTMYRCPQTWAKRKMLSRNALHFVLCVQTMLVKREDWC